MHVTYVCTVDTFIYMYTHTHAHKCIHSYNFPQRFLMYIAHKSRNFAIITWGILVYMYTLQAVLQGWLPLRMGSTCEGH